MSQVLCAVIHPPQHQPLPCPPAAPSGTLSKLAVFPHCPLCGPPDALYWLLSVSNFTHAVRTLRCHTAPIPSRSAPTPMPRTHHRIQRGKAAPAFAVPLMAREGGGQAAQRPEARNRRFM